MVSCSRVLLRGACAPRRLSSDPSTRAILPGRGGAPQQNGRRSTGVQRQSKDKGGKTERASISAEHPAQRRVTHSCCCCPRGEPRLAHGTSLDADPERAG